MLDFMMVQKLPRKPTKKHIDRTRKKALQTMLWDLYYNFEIAGYSHAEVLWSTQDYKNKKACYGSLYHAIEKSKLDLKLSTRGEKIFISRPGLKVKKGGHVK